MSQSLSLVATDNHHGGYPLSAAQRQLWFFAQLEPESCAYNLGGWLWLEGELDRAALTQALNELVERHEMLRACFRDHQGEPLQMIMPMAPFALGYEDLSTLSKPETVAKERGRELLLRPYDLNGGEVFRHRLYCLGSKRHMLVLGFHHIVFDAWSFGVFMGELMSCYESSTTHKPLKLPRLRQHYVDYSLGQQQWLQGEQAADQLAYWQTRLGQHHRLLNLPMQRLSGSVQRAEHYLMPVEGDLTKRLDKLSRQVGVSRFTVLLAVLQLLLARLSGQEEVRVGVPSANRSADTAKIVGFLVNNWVVAGRPLPSLSVSQWIQQVKSHLTEARQNGRLPFETLVEALAPERHPGLHPLFQVAFNYRQQGGQQSWSAGGLDARFEEMMAVETPFSLVLDVAPILDEGLTLRFIAGQGVFSDPFMEQLTEGYLRLLEQCAERPNATLATLDMLTASSRQQLLLWSVGSEAYARGVTLAELISAQAVRAPEAEALVSGEERVSYGELEARSARLGRWLRAQGVGAETVVGVLLERGVGMIASFLGILKAGGAFLPLDPDYPEERLGYMLRDSGVELLLSESGLAGRLPAVAGLRVVALDRLDYGAEEAGELAVPVHPQQLAYVIYTSGSTGQPKGVGVTHGGLSMHVQSIGERYGMGPEDVELHFASISFDGAVERWAVPLAFGSRLVIREQGLWSAERTCQVLEEEGVSIACFPPSYVGPLLDWIEHRRPPLKVRSWTLGGEAFTRELYERLQRVLKPRRILNGYGPTETVVTPLLWEADRGTPMSSAYAPIGTAVGARRLYVLDGDLNRVPPGVSGELYIGGEVGLARGYWGRAGQTAERFLPDRWGVPGERMYRTGDWVRWRADGVVEYLGRVDGQVKLRGFRIELGEIETRLLALAPVREAVVVMRPGPGGERLVGYVAAPAEVEGERLRAALAAQLPEYMVPSQVVRLEALPLTPAGKVDREGLPEPQWSAEGYEPPRTEAERMLAQVWGQLLGVERVGRQDRFFELGGDSIIALQVVSRARQAGWSLRPRDLFEQPTLTALAAVAETTTTTMIEQAPLMGEVEMTPIQARFLEREGAAICNQYFWFQLDAPSNPEDLQAALQALCAHHDVLRSRFYRHKGQWHQIFQAPEKIKSELLWVREAQTKTEIQRFAASAQQSLDIESGELLRALYISSPGQPDRLLLCIHHLAVDGVSWRILLEDLLLAYRQSAAGQPIHLPAKTHSLRDWTGALAAWAQDEAQAQQAFWQAMTADVPPLWDMNQQPTEAQTLRLVIPAEMTRRAMQVAQTHLRSNLDDLLVMTLARVLAQHSGQSAVRIYREGHGRDLSFSGLDLSRTVGWFTSLYPLLLRVPTAREEALKGLKEQLHAVHNQGLAFGALSHWSDWAPANHRIEVLFNYLGQLQWDGQGTLSFLSAGLWRSPGSRRDAPLVINAHQQEGELIMALEFSPLHFEPSLQQALMAAFEVELKALIDCCEQHGPWLTPSDVPLSGLDQEALDQLSNLELENVLPLSPLQQGLLFHSELSQQTDTYVNQLSLPLSGLDSARLEQAWQRLVQRHSVLRSALLAGEGKLDQPLLGVWQSIALPWSQQDLRGEEDAAQAMERVRTERRQQGFNLYRPPLWHVDLLQTGDEDYHCVLTLHHLLMDGWSTAILLQELLQLYHGQTLLPEPPPFSAFLQWLADRDQMRARAFWQDYLSAITSPTWLASSMGQISEAKDFRRHSVIFDSKLQQHLQDQARQQGVTLSTLMQGAWALILSRYTGQQQVVFGNTVAGRPPELPGSERMLGLFINTLPVAVKIPAAEPCGRWLLALQQAGLDAREHGHLPLFEIQQAAGCAGEGLFDTLMVFENYPLDDNLLNSKADGLTIGAPDSYEFTHYPLTLAVLPGTELQVVFAYNAAVLPPRVIAPLADAFKQVLMALATQPEAPLASIASITPEQSHRLLLWSVGSEAYARGVTLAELISAQAVRAPEAEALVSGEERVSYGELEARSARLGRWLRAQGVGAETVVGVLLERGVGMIASFLGILKAGGAFLPLDPDYPEERLGYMLRDSGVELLLSESGLAGRLPAVAGLRVVALDRLDYGAEEAGELAVPVHPQQLAYVIYTSGSTGQPKGVGVTHGGLSMHVQSIGERYGMGPEDVELHFASISFDGAVERWAVPLAFGSRLVIREQGLWSAERTCQVLEEEGVSIACFPPSYVGPLLDWIEHRRPPLKVRSWTLGGEAFTRELYERLQRVLKPRRILNGYGPTETVVTPLLWEADRGTPMSSAYAPIGTAVGARRLYVLDGDLNRVPPGVSGELYIGGEVGLARGYWGRAGQTAERFLPDRWGVPGERMYRTGDWVRWRADGVVEYLGRVDGQVKLRGFRIELGEIETRLLALAPVREAVVVMRPGPGGERLVGYVAAPAEVEGERLRAALAAQLPEYMVPSQVVRLEALPLTPAGKVDREGLPEPQWSAEGYEPPRTEAERMLAQVWGQLLGVERVGRQDRFFELGGHSLLAMQAVSLLRRDYQKQLPLQVLFDSPRLADCAARLIDAVDEDEIIVAAPRDQDLPTSSAQRRLWFVQQLNPESGAYHLPLGLRLQGTLDLTALQAALNHLVEQHEILRTRFVEHNGEPRQRILPEAPLKLDYIDLREQSQPQDRAAELFQEWLRQPFDLARDPLLRLGVVRLDEHCYQLLLVQHHIITDGRSTAHFLESLINVYGAIMAGELLLEAPPRLQYADYAIWQQRWLQGKKAQQQLDYWRQALGTDTEPLELPTDYPRSRTTPPQGARYHFRLSTVQAQGLRQLARAHETTLFTPLLSLWLLLLSRYSGRRDIRVGIPVAGRIRPETETMLGCFINTVVLGVQIDPNSSFAALMEQVKQRSAEAQSHQELPFEALVEALGVGHSLEYHPLFQVAFNHQQMITEALAEWPQGSITPFDPGAAGVQFDLAMDTELQGDGSIHGYLSYASQLFHKATIERLWGHYSNLLDAVLNNGSGPVANLPLLSQTEQQQLGHWNDSGVARDPFVPIPIRQSRQAMQTPEAVALSFNGRQLSYGELERRVNQLAHRLQRAGIGPEVRVAISLHRSVELVVGILAITRAGGAYVPLDPSYPEERLRYILAAAEPALVLTQSTLALTGLEDTGCPCWSLDDLDCGDEPTYPPMVDWHPDQAFYVIYTSGSTGRPKGVVNTHAALENRLLWMQEQYLLGGDDCVLQKTPFSFDVSVWEFFWPFMVGARLAVAPPEAHRDPVALQRVIESEQVTTLHFVPSMLQAFIAATHLVGCASLRKVICSGEALSMDLQQQVLQARPKLQLHNLYGPTEAAIDVSYWQCQADNRPTVPIGMPISNIQLHVLDAQLNPVPIGIPGELYLAGVGLARGYFGRADLTAERFLPNPFGAPGSRMYRTGDKVKRGADGVLEYLGRLDHQVKIRGLRIELGEIESLLRQQPFVSDALVIAQPHSIGDQLVAYVILDGMPAEDWREQLKAALSAQLPDYMVPALFMSLDGFPISPNGKLDRKALPAPEWQSKGYRAPQTPLQQQLAECWRCLLKQPRIGLDDNFFALGGHSLLAVRAVAQVREQLDLEISLRQFFQCESLEALANQLEYKSMAGEEEERNELDAMAALLNELGEL
ncbi:non-ribosomal peptide synthetase [Nitrosococcus wardiae]|uniref:Amino acid adenylation domain-containing protein n=1 Tax=Nitrosococcus wardiae TaxID=1814290 RepID=A0A4P7C2W8_9GAMM|nr:non-ribosomal peptide synthetase [Nitrosococcus wardiae]QBQ55216.1 amino acid adenylation domain-containing protein [Nitrosococcus wardiae]